MGLYGAWCGRSAVHTETKPRVSYDGRQGGEDAMVGGDTTVRGRELLFGGLRASRARDAGFEVSGDFCPSTALRDGLGGTK